MIETSQHFDGKNRQLMDTGQLLERFRTLSRDIQNNIQSIQRQIEITAKGGLTNELQKISNTTNEIAEAWQDFSGWILVSTLENFEEARANCAIGRLDIKSKITRSKKRIQNELSHKGVKIESTEVESLVIETYIPYFEQLLDLIFTNALKYAPRASTIECSTSKKSNYVTITVSSIGPTVQKNEVGQLGNIGFRSENAKKLPVAGQGYGLYNCKRISHLLNSRIEFKPDLRTSVMIAGIQYSTFEVNLIFQINNNDQ